MTSAIAQERELTLRIRALNKAVTSDEPVSNILIILDEIKKNAAPNEEMIRSTKAGVFIGKLRSNSNKEVARVAADIVAKWKRNVDAAKAAKQKSKLDSPAAVTPSAASPAPSAAPGPRQFTGDTEKRHWKEEGVDLDRTDSGTRNNVIGLLYNGLAYQSNLADQELLAKAIEVEHAGFKAYNGETNGYKTKMRSLVMNLKNKKAGHLRKGVMSGDITPAKFVVMSDSELLSTEQRLRDKALQAENMKKAQVPTPDKVFATSIECTRCHKKTVSYTQAQTRSADEPMTTFATCSSCGHRWKVSRRTNLSPSCYLHFLAPVLSIVWNNV
jgi:transcription elongation factor S-II